MLLCLVFSKPLLDDFGLLLIPSTAGKPSTVWTAHPRRVWLTIGKSLTVLNRKGVPTQPHILLGEPLGLFTTRLWINQFLMNALFMLVGPDAQVQQFVAVMAFAEGFAHV